MARQIQVGEVVGRAMSTYGAQAGLLLPAALLVFVPVAVVDGLLEASDDSPALLTISLVVTLIASFWFQGMVVEAVRDIQDGRRDFTLGELVRSPAPVLGTMIAAGLLAGLGVVVGFILLVVPGLVLLTWWAVVIPVVVVERLGIAASFRRSRELVRGNGWRVFGAIVLFVVVLAVVSGVIAAVLFFLSDSPVGAAAASLVSNVLVVPVYGVAMATMYFALRDAHGEAPVPAVPDRSYGTGGGFAPPQSPTPQRPDIGLE